MSFQTNKSRASRESGLNKKYQASEFTLISTNFWNGEKWDLANMASPWLEIGKELVHPSGLLSTQNPEQWPIRRWKSTYSGTIEVLWSIHRFHNNKDSANGFTGKFYINGKLQDQVLVTPSGQPNISRKLRLEIKEGDFLDFAISPEGIDGSHYIGWDYSKLNIAISALSSEQTSETQMNNPDIEYLHSFIQSSATYEQNVAFTKKCNSLNQSADYKSSRMVQHRTGWSCMVIDDPSNESTTDTNENSNNNSNEGQESKPEVEHIYEFIARNASYAQAVTFTNNCKELSSKPEYKSSRMVQNASGWNCMAITATEDEKEGQNLSLAHSAKDWSIEGKQGYKNWYYGYFNYGKDQDKKYQTSEFTLINTEHWTGNKWELTNMASPRMEIGKELV
ncbi:hypothetical protein [Zooshikella ganghwensis]|uniref:hypothetical protein n=1 Tax=Zooshikella ganghwensis TaxID=202772 RepID=UPI0003FF950F|nr:hypothetical protein [Zooshikella ganghwensis]